MDSKAHGQELLAALTLRTRRIPSASTVYRRRRPVGKSLEAAVTRYSQTLNAADAASGGVVGADGKQRTGWALDGREVCGAGQQGQAVHVLSLVRHASGLGLKQCQVGQKTLEIGATPAWLKGLDLHACVVTLDALLCQGKILHQILAQGGDSLAIVKDNHQQLYQAILSLFEQPPQPALANDFRSTTRQARRHGRLAQRTLLASAALQDYLT